MVVEFFEVVVGGCRLLLMVLGGFRSFHVLVTTTLKHINNIFCTSRRGDMSPLIQAE